MAKPFHSILLYPSLNLHELTVPLCYSSFAEGSSGACACSGSDLTVLSGSWVPGPGRFPLKSHETPLSTMFRGEGTGPSSEAETDAGLETGASTGTGTGAGSVLPLRGGVGVTSAMLRESRERPRPMP